LPSHIYLNHNILLAGMEFLGKNKLCCRATFVCGYVSLLLTQ
jgi:hypothetical protein